VVGVTSKHNVHINFCENLTTGSTAEIVGWTWPVMWARVHAHTHTQNCPLVSLIAFLSSMHNYTKKWHTNKNISAMPLFHTETFIYKQF